MGFTVHKKKNRNNKFIFVGLVVLVCSILVYSLFDIQIVKGEQYYSDTVNPRFSLKEIKAKRGIIYDRNGVKLVENQAKYNVYVDKSVEEDETVFNDMLKEISELFNIDIKANYERDRQRRPWAEEVQIISKADYYPNIFELEANYYKYNKKSEQIIKIEEEYVRKYNFPEYLSHVIGYVGKVSADELAANEELDEKDVVGKFGLEKGLDDRLRGVDGIERTSYLVAEDKQVVSTEKSVANGEDIYLSINIEYQRKMYELIQNALEEIEELNRTRSVAAVVEDVKTGEILSLVSYPTFNSNDFVNGLTVEQNEEYLNDPGKPLTNKALQYAQSPGSIFKPLTSLTTLQHGAINRNTTFFTGGSYIPETQTSANPIIIYDAGGKDWGTVDVVGGICNSSNIFHVKSVMQMNPNEAPYKIEDNFQKMGLHEPSGLPLGFESVGSFPTPEKLEEQGKTWLPGFLWNSSYGQGDVLLTPIGAAKLTSTIASNGQINQQTIVKDQEKEQSEMGIALEHFNAVKEGMLCSGNKTSSWVGYDPEEYISVADKTGTAETGQLIDGRELIHGWEISFAPYEDPEIAISIFMEDGGSGWRGGYISREFYKYYSEINKTNKTSRAFSLNNL